MSHAEARLKKEKEASIEKNEIHKGWVISIIQEKIEIPGEKTRFYDIVSHPGATAILPVTKEGKIILVRQWRRAAQEILLELPAGVLESGEDPAACAQRELQEETGFRANRLTPLTRFYTAPGFTNEHVHLFLGEDLEKAPLQAEDTDEIDTVTYSLEEVLDLIEQQKIIDAKTILGAYMYLGMKK